MFLILFSALSIFISSPFQFYVCFLRFHLHPSSPFRAPTDIIIRAKTFLHLLPLAPFCARAYILSQALRIDVSRFQTVPFD